jgi:hypothetical protein
LNDINAHQIYGKWLLNSTGLHVTQLENTNPAIVSAFFSNDIAGLEFGSSRTLNKAYTDDYVFSWANLEQDKYVKILLSQYDSFMFSDCYYLTFKDNTAYVEENFYLAGVLTTVDYEPLNVDTSGLNAFTVHVEFTPSADEYAQATLSITLNDVVILDNTGDYQFETYFMHGVKKQQIITNDISLVLTGINSKNVGQIIIEGDSLSGLSTWANSIYTIATFQLDDEKFGGPFITFILSGAFVLVIGFILASFIWKA